MIKSLTYLNTKSKVDNSGYGNLTAETRPNESSTGYVNYKVITEASSSVSKQMPPPLSSRKLTMDAHKDGSKRVTTVRSNPSPVLSIKTTSTLAATDESDKEMLASG
jgi:hypothetical protein